MSLEIKKKEIELKRVILGKEEMEFRIEERRDEIERLKQQMIIQDAAIERINKEIETLKNK